MLSNRSIPNAIIIPELGYDDGTIAARWLCDAFGFVERLRIANHRVQLTLGEGAAIVVKEHQKNSTTSRADHAIMVRVDDVDAIAARAEKLGADIAQPPTSHVYGERQCTIIDIGSHAWAFTQSIADVAPSEWGGELVG